MLELTPNDKLIFGDALRQNQLPEFNQQLNNLANTRERQAFLTALPSENPNMYAALPQKIINTIRGG
ncbi:hypothetical protein ACTXN8_23690 [Pseudomonas helleri]